MKHTWWQSGDYNAICDVCGFKLKASTLKRRWDGLMVCEKDWEIRHPQELIRPIPDQSKLPWTRPEGTDQTIAGAPTSYPARTYSPIPAGTPALYHLVVTTQPVNTFTSTTLSSVTVTINNIDGTVASNVLGNAYISITNNPAGVTLSGTLAQAFSSGIATFDDLSIDIAGTYTFSIVADFTESVTTNSFTISSEIPTQTWTQTQPPVACTVFFTLGDYVYATHCEQVGDEGKVYRTTDPTSAAAWTLANSNAFGIGVIRTHGGIGVLGSTAYLVGGRNATTPQAEVWSSTNGSTWTNLTTTAAFGAVEYCHVVPFNNKLYLLSYHDGSNYQNAVYSSSDGITWTLVNTPGWGGSASTARYSFGACVFNSKLWIIGGKIGLTGQTDVWNTSDGSTWTQVTTNGGFAASAYSSISTRNYMISVAGDTNRVYYSSNGTTWTSVGTITLSGTFPSGLTLAASGSSAQGQFTYRGKEYFASYAANVGINLGLAYSI